MILLSTLSAIIIPTMGFLLFPQLQEVRPALSITGRRFGSPSGNISSLLFFLKTSSVFKASHSPELLQEKLSNYWILLRLLNFTPLLRIYLNNFRLLRIAQLNGVPQPPVVASVSSDFWLFSDLRNILDFSKTSLEVTISTHPMLTDTQVKQICLSATNIKKGCVSTYSWQHVSVEWLSFCLKSGLTN